MADFNGYILPSFGDIYYGSMELQLSSYSCGFISEAISISNRFTNPTESDITLNTVIFNSITGGTLSSLAEGKIFAPDEYVDFTINIPKDGETVLNGTVTFVFDDDTTYTFSVTGVRAIFWIYRPKDNSYTEGLNYQTIIFETDSGVEKRKKLLTSPLHYVSQEINKTDLPKLAKMFAITKLTLLASFTVPLWLSGTRLTSALNSGGFIANCDTRYVPVGSTGNLIIFRDEETFDYVPFTSKTDNYFALGSAVTNSYNIGDIVIPCFFGKVKENFPNYAVMDYNYDMITIRLEEEAV